MADGSRDVTFSTSVPEASYSIGRPHTCSQNYPLAALAAHAEGTTRVGFDVTVEGTIKDPKIEQSSGNKDLDDAALHCVGFWRYKPAMQDSKPVEAAWQANVVWKIAPPLTVLAALVCLRQHPDQPASSTTLGQTAFNFHVMQDGSVTDARVIQSSGEATWDDLGLACVRARRFDVSIFFVPSDGLRAHLEMDWTGAQAYLSNAAVPPPNPGATSSSK